MAPPSTPSQDDLKRIAAFRAVELVKSGMVVGLGTGSTAAHVVDRIGELLRSGHLRDVVGVPTSDWAAARATAAGIPLTNLGTHLAIDLSIDGADEVDSALNLVKGRGGSLLREKMVESASRRFVVVVDESKRVRRLGGSGMAVPVEVVPFGWALTLKRLRELFDDRAPGFSLKLRSKNGSAGVVLAAGDDEVGESETPFVTDNGNYIVDLYFGEEGIPGDHDMVSDEMLRIAGVVEHGMFLGLATSVIVAGVDGVTVQNKK